MIVHPSPARDPVGRCHVRPPVRRLLSHREFAGAIRMIVNESRDCAQQVRRSLDGAASTIFDWRPESRSVSCRRRMADQRSRSPHLRLSASGLRAHCLDRGRGPAAGAMRQDDRLGTSSTGPERMGRWFDLDPDDGRIYRLAARLETDGTLHARIFKGVPLFGRTEILTRVDIRSLTGRR